MKAKAAHRLAKEILENASVEVFVSEDYSGRGMFGRTTHAIETRSRDETARALEAVPGLKKYRRDSMGLGAVWY